MKIYNSALFAIVLALCVSCGTQQETFPVAKHNVIWDSPGVNSRGSMPVGNGDIGANVWVNPAGELYLLISKTDAWNENGQLLKIGRIKLNCRPALPVGHFRQELDLETGTVRITGKQDDGRTLSLSVWIDANHPVIHVEGESSEPVQAGVLYDGWRSSPHVLKGGETSAAYGVTGGSSPVVTDADTLFTRENGLLWCHHNTRSIWRETLEVQALQDYPDADRDPLLHRTFGALVYGDGFVNSSPEALTMDKPDKRFRVSIAVSALLSNTVADWETSLRQTAERVAAVPFDDRRAAHERYWKDVWLKNYIVVDSPDDSLAVAGISEGYQLQRYMNICAGRGNMPIKFNGSIFTVDSTDEAHPFNPDYRNWGGCYWFQNTRLPYWTMLHSGDFDLMKPLFRMYMDALPLARYRTVKYYGHAGCFFPETMYFWGTYNNDNYGWNREGKPDGLTDNRYIRYYWQSGIELVAMMLDYYEFTRDGTFL
ncbi:MAG: DUF5703 domain-containing protein, partial [Tannerella sp.]|nr:DUF5703 domain-containing protein [Tannerella sp.]